MKNPICVALDVDNLADLKELINKLHDVVGMFKVGLELYTAFGPKVIDIIRDYGDCGIFLDLKYHDISTTISKAASVATRLGVDVLNLHAANCVEGMKSVVESVNDTSKFEGLKKPKIIAVTVLTTISPEQLLNELLISTPMSECVTHFANLAKIAGLDGVVASPQEAAALRSKFGPDFYIVTPGIRPKGLLDEKDDQKRISTPKSALENGSDTLVIGRPITQAVDPRRAVESILNSLN